MRRVKVEITSDNPEDKGPATFTVEKETGAGTTEVEKKVVPFDLLSKGMVFNLNEDEKLTVEPYTKEAIAYSPVQYAAYIVADQEKLGEIDSPTNEPTPEMKAVWELERKRMENDTGIKQPPLPGPPVAGGKNQPPPGGVISSDQVKGRSTVGPPPDHPSPIAPRPEDLKKEQVEREKKEAEEAAAKEKIDEERRKKEEALGRPKK